VGPWLCRAVFAPDSTAAAGEKFLPRQNPNRDLLVQNPKAERYPERSAVNECGGKEQSGAGSGRRAGTRDQEGSIEAERGRRVEDQQDTQQDGDVSYLSNDRREEGRERIKGRGQGLMERGLRRDGGSG
jgi:hypothetical protein